MTEVDSSLPRMQRMVVAIAHPDDESFGLGALLSAFITQGSQVSVVCFTRGENSTLGGQGPDLTSIRRQELHAASQVLGIEQVDVLSYPDGGLAAVALDDLRDEVLRRATDADGFLVFDEGGITGHPDHCQATCAALMAAEARDLPVLAWTIPHTVAEQLNAEFGTAFLGREETQLDLCIHVDRGRQRQAISMHRSQVANNPVLWRRLQLLGDRECLRYLRPADDQRHPRLFPRPRGGTAQ